MVSASVEVTSGPAWPGSGQVAAHLRRRAVRVHTGRARRARRQGRAGDVLRDRRLREASTAPLLAAMSAAGHSVQNHSGSHPHLAAFPPSRSSNSCLRRPTVWSRRPVCARRASVRPTGRPCAASDRSPRPADCPRCCGPPTRATSSAPAPRSSSARRARRRGRASTHDPDARRRRDPQPDDRCAGTSHRRVAGARLRVRHAVLETDDERGPGGSRTERGPRSVHEACAEPAGGPRRDRAGARVRQPHRCPCRGRGDGGGGRLGRGGEGCRRGNAAGHRRRRRRIGLRQRGRLCRPRPTTSVVNFAAGAVTASGALARVVGGGCVSS